MEPRAGIRILPEQLAPATLRGVIEECVTRDGTELTEAAAKVRQVEELLRRGEVEIWFDAATGTCSIALVGR
jgi:uncharacterized protein YheU (UPF0270 family)